ncbi:MAG: leucine-rich repeat domain-containing protein, partial [Clostridia bacterium]|nr:leucine-rich repeat domain-containing protein [Clostridia bacterium]
MFKRVLSFIICVLMLTSVFAGFELSANEGVAEANAVASPDTAPDYVESSDAPRVAAPVTARDQNGSVIRPGLAAASYSGSCGSYANWSLDTSTGVLTIAGSGRMYDYSSTSSTTYAPWKSYVSYIKKVVFGGSVTHIGSYAFVGCKKLESIHIPATIKSMGYRIFDNCPLLKSIYVSDMAAWCNIDRADGAYSGSYYDYEYDLYLGNELVTHLEIPSSVTVIKKWAFWGVSSFKTVSIPNSVTKIEYSGFCNCRG